MCSNSFRRHVDCHKTNRIIYKKDSKTETSTIKKIYFKTINTKDKKTVFPEKKNVRDINKSYINQKEKNEHKRT